MRVLLAHAQTGPGVSPNTARPPNRSWAASLRRSPLRLLVFGRPLPVVACGLALRAALRSRGPGEPGPRALLAG